MRSIQHALLASFGLLLLLPSCNTSGSRSVVSADPAARDPLLAYVAALEGEWQSDDGEGGTTITEFRTSSGGSAVRELMMRGTDHEMTNMYTLDGNGLTLTHYCAGGNQPSMRATAVDGDRLVFEFEGVRDLKASDEVFMGAMTLVRIDGDRVEQHWSAMKGDDVDHGMVIALTRVR